MDPEQNNLYPNNNQMPNNQPLDNQGVDNMPNQSMTPDNNDPTQPQPTQDYQQPVNQPVTPNPVPQPTSQPTQSFEPPINQPNIPEPIPQPTPQPIPQPTPQPAPQPMQQDFNQPPKKKKTGLIIAIIIAIIILAVGAIFLIKHLQKADTKTTDNKVTDSSQTKTQKPEKTTSKVDSNVNFRSYPYKVAGEDIYVDVPDFREVEEGFSRIFLVHGEKYVAVTAEKSSTASDLNTAHEVAFAKFMGNIQGYSYVNSLSVTSDSIETINGIEVYKYEGAVNCGQSHIYDAYVIGYSFIMDDVPCTITGSVINHDQPPEMIAEIKAIVEAMIHTLRSEE